MGIAEIALIGVGLSMDAVAVSMTNGMVYRNLRRVNYVAMPVFFSLFQAGMPLIGYFAGGLFADVITKYSGFVILLILGIIGGKMIKEGIAHFRSQEPVPGKDMTPGVLIFQAVATSIDAFAVGIGFSVIHISILPAISLIGVITAFLVIVAILIGRKFGDILGSRAEVLGGVILVIIGIKAII